MADFKYVIYDQFHWKSKDHFVRFYYDRDYALFQYGFFKQSFPNLSLGFTSKENFDKLVQSLH